MTTLRLNLSRVFLLSMAISSSISAAIAADTESLIKQIQPFITANTAAVVHIDATRLEIAPLFETARQWRGAPKDQLAGPEQLLTAAVAGIREAGVKDVFLLLEPTDLPAQGPLVVLPVEQGSDDKVAMLLKPFGLVTARQGDVLLAGKEHQVTRKPDGANVPTSAISEAFAAAGDSVVRAAVVPSDDHRRVIEELFPKLPEEVGGGETKNLARGVKWVAVGLNPPPKLKLTGAVGATSPESAMQINEVVKSGLAALAKVPELKKLVPQVESILKSAAPKVQGSQLTLVLNGDRREGPTLANLLQPAILQSRRSAMRAQSVNNLKQLAIATYMHEDTQKTFPPAYIAKDGKPLLSWRVMILPYIEQAELYQQFKLDEPWDSEHNRQLIRRMPKTYRAPSSMAPEGHTVYLAPRGDETMFPGAKGTKLQDVRDGTSKTIMIVEASDDRAVEWTKPDDWKLDPANPSAGLGQLDEVFNAALADGSVRSIKVGTDPKILKALFTRSGGEAIGEF